MINPPISATLYITNHCQFSCDHCFLTDLRRLNKDHLEFKLVNKILDDFQRHKIFLVVVAGGDPTLHPEFYDIIGEIRKRKMLPLIGVNAVHYDEQFFNFLKDLSIFHLQVSIDSTLEIDGIYQRPLREYSHNIKRIVDNKIKLTVAITVTNYNSSQCISLCRELFAIGVWRIKISFWQSTKWGIEKGIKEIAKKEKLRVLSDIRKFFGISREFAFPGYIEPSLGKFIEIKGEPPRLVVNANASLAFDEFGKPIGGVDGNNDIVGIYISARYKYAEKRRLEIFNYIKNKYDISSIYESSRNIIGASGSIFLLPNSERYILISDDLSPQEKLFVFIHEVGHIDLNLMGNNKIIGLDREKEIKVNCWAVNFLSEYITYKFYKKIMDLSLSDDEENLFKEIRNNLDANLLLQRE